MKDLSLQYVSKALRLIKFQKTGAQEHHTAVSIERSALSTDADMSGADTIVTGGALVASSAAVTQPTLVIVDSVMVTSDSNVVVADSNLVLTDPDMANAGASDVCPESNAALTDSSMHISVSNITMSDHSMVISDSNIVIPDSDSISQFSVDTGNCESLEIASTCSIPDMSEYLPCEEVMSFQSETYIQNEVDVRPEICTRNVANIANDMRDQYKTTHSTSDVHEIKEAQLEKKLHSDTGMGIIRPMQTRSVANQENTETFTCSAVIVGEEFQSLSTLGTIAKAKARKSQVPAQAARLVTSNGRQYLKYHNAGENVHILVPVQTQGSEARRNEVEEFISMATDISTGSNVEVSTADCHTSIKKAEKRERDRINKRLRRKDPEYRAINREKTKAIMQQKRADESYRSAEREKDRIRRAEARKMNKSLREREKARDRKYQYYKRMQQNIGGPIHVLPVFSKEEEVICTINEHAEENIDEVSL